MQDPSRGTTDIAPSVADRVARDVSALAEFKEPGLPGWTRRVFSDPYVASRTWIAELMSDAGLEANVDAATNVIGTLPGHRSDLPPLVIGSHTDSVPGGGRFDGIIGVLGGIEAVRVLRESGLRLERTLRVVDFAGEEANDFGISCIGSRALSGSLSARHLELRDPMGRTLGDVLTAAGGDAHAALGLSWASAPPAAFLELHIEQGPVLEQAGVPIGVVTGIVGIHRVTVSIEGQADHAGTTPMRLRRDAACAAADVVLGVEHLPVGEAVATVGRIEIQPGASNVVPSGADLLVEIRSEDAAWLLKQRGELESVVNEIAQRRAVHAALDWHQGEDPVLCASYLQEVVARSAEQLGLGHRLMPSGAGHDAVMMASVTDVGMVFVPSKGGRSHTPEEWTDPGQIAAGVNVLARSIVELDGTLPRRVRA